MNNGRSKRKAVHLLPVKKLVLAKTFSPLASVNVHVDVNVVTSEIVPVVKDPTWVPGVLESDPAMKDASTPS